MATARIPGTVGAVISIVIVPFAVDEPLLFAAVKVYVVVDVGLTTVEPELEAEVKAPGVIAIEVIVPVAFQERVELPPGPM